MRYQNLKSFHKHLANSAPHNLCKMYLVVMPDDFERQCAIQKILSYVKTPDSLISKFFGTDFELKDFLDALLSAPLFGEPLIVLDLVDKIDKKTIKIISENLHSGATVILGASGKTTLVNVVEKEGVILDLLDEKPWDKEKRISEELVERAKNAGKKIDSDVPALLIERLGLDPALLYSEIDKLICYVGNTPLSISRNDVLTLSPASKAASTWQIAEDVIWEGGSFPVVDSSLFHSLIPALRSQIHLGLILSKLIEENIPSDCWSSYIPKIWPKTLEKRTSQAARHGSKHFRKALEKLFDIELMSRNNSTQYRPLLDLFRASLYAR